MIRFHKVLHKNLPATFERNQQHMWFTSEGAIFVGDANGIPKQMGIGYKEVDSVPTGVPDAAGLVRYAKGTKKYYLSTDTDWIELLTGAQPGSSSGPGYAGGVIVTDVNNNFTSGDVEGALLELANALKPVMGSKTLPSYSGNVFANDDAGEWGLTSTATNRPASSSTPAWLMQRKTTDGSLVGFIIDKNGEMYVRYGDAYKRVATGSDTGEISDDLASLLNKVNNGLKLNVGDGLQISNGGNLANNPTISLAPGAGGNGFVRTIGDTMTGTLKLSSFATIQFDNTGQNVIDMKSGQPGAARMQIVNYVQGFRISDLNKNISPIFFNNADSRLYLNGTNGTDSLVKSSAKAIVAQAPLMVEHEPVVRDESRFPTTNPANVYAFYADNRNGNISIARGGNAALAVRNPSNHTFNHIRLEATNRARVSGSRTSMQLSGLNGENMFKLQINADTVHMSEKLHVGNLLVVGSNVDWGRDRGTVDSENRLVLHARTGRVFTSPTSVDQRWVAQMSYYRHERNRDEIHMNIADIGQGLYDTTGWQGAPVTVTAGRFRADQFENASSIKYKENIEKYDEKALEIVDNLDVFKYNYKNDEDKNATVGFIIEKGVPEIAITGAGDALDPYAMVAVLWKAVKELSAEVKELKG